MERTVKVFYLIPKGTMVCGQKIWGNIITKDERAFVPFVRSAKRDLVKKQHPTTLLNSLLQRNHGILN